jgi:hypothetical protein
VPVIAESKSIFSAHELGGSEAIHAWLATGAGARNDGISYTAETECAGEASALREST